MYNLSIEATIPLLIMAGIVSSIIASLIGLGGGLVAIPLIMLVIGDHNLEAKLIAYVSILVLSIFSIWKYKRQGLSPDWRNAIWIGLGVIPATVLCEHFVGPLLESYSTIFHFVYAGVVVIVTILIFFRDKWKIKKLKTWTLPIFGLVIGSLSGSMGFSGGVLFMPLLTVGLKMDLKKAAVSSLALKLVAAFSNVITGIGSGHYQNFEANGVYWFLPLVIIIGSIVGSQIGPRLSKKMSIRQMDIFFLVVMLIIIAWELTRGILATSGITI